ncbi:helix-turn-helix domain-containing protein [Gordonia hongkongensis]|uniref:helix-turn-helix domain-containing protein n=1 Tax=Gordonia hongkongensis TaxID=1701090 RepID=UPI003D760002
MSTDHGAALPAKCTIQQVADHEQVSVKTVRRWIADGRLPAHKIGPRQIRVRRQDVESLGEPIVTAGSIRAGK